MSRKLLNILFIQTENSQVALHYDNISVAASGEELFQTPLDQIESIYAFGLVHITSPLMMRCADEGKSIVYFDFNGKFRARVTGKPEGSVLLRAAQWKTGFDSVQSLDLAKSIVEGKIQNSKQVLLRGIRESENNSSLTSAVQALSDASIQIASVHNIDELRGIEGSAAQAYFSSFDELLSCDSKEFAFHIRSRRPPKNRTNAVLSFLYSLGVADCVSALVGVGLDYQFGFLHAMRPGRPALALDLIEEFRSVIYDRLALSMINRRQLRAEHFEEVEGGGWYLNAAGRKILFTCLHNRRAEEISHPLFKEKVPVGLLAHIQAMLLARYLRGDSPKYLPYFAPSNGFSRTNF